IFKRRTKHRGPEETARKEEDSSSRSRNAERRPDSAASSAKSYYTYDGGSATSMEGKSRNGVPLRGWNRRKSTAYDEHDPTKPENTATSQVVDEILSTARGWRGAVAG
ncbi:hypothetical protein JCM5350_001120, partial [Sporobolomyces pararoseus]